MKKLLGVSLLLLALIAALIHTLVLTPMREERRAAVTAFLQSLPGQCMAGEVAVEVLTGNVILKNVVWQGAQQDAGGHELRAQEITLKGVNIEAAQGSGPERLFRGALFSGLELVVGEAAGPENPGREHMRLAGARLGELRGDAAPLLQWLRGELPPAKRLTALLSLSLDSLAVTDYSNAMNVPGLGEVMFRARSSSFQDLRLLSSGRGVWEGISAGLDGSEVLSLDLLTVDSVCLPDFLTPIAGSGDGQDEPVLLLDLLAIMEKDALAVKNLELTGLVLAPPGGEKLAARRLFFDLDSQENETHFKQQSEELRLSPGFAAGALPALASLFQSYGKDLTLNSAIDLDFKRIGAQWDWQIRDFFVEERSVGAIKAKCDLFLDGEGEQEFWDSGFDCYLRHCSLRLTDKEAVAVFLRASAPDPSQMDGGRLELMRRHIAESFEIDAANADGLGTAALYRGLARISRAPGSLLVVLAPKEPVLLEPGQDLSEELNISVEYTPAGIEK